MTVALPRFGAEALDPSLDTTEGLNYHGHMYDPLVGATPDGQHSNQFGVLESWKPNSDGTVWTITLKSGVTFHNGQEMTAEDIRFTLEHFSRPEAICSSCNPLRTVLDRVEIVDSHTLQVVGKKPFNFSALVSSVEGDIRVLPKSYYEDVGAEGFIEHPVGSGPWKFADRQVGNFIEFEANTNYWNEARIPQFARLRIVLAPEASTRVAMLRTGEADLVSLEPDDVEPLKGEGFKIFGPKAAATISLHFNGSYNPNFLSHKVEFRKAFALGVDWNAIVEAFYPEEVGERYSGGVFPFSPGTLGADPDLPPYPYDPEEAKRLLAESGYNGETIVFWAYSFNSNPEQLEVDQAIAEQLKELGVDVRITPIDFTSFRAKLAAEPQDFDPPAALSVNPASTRPSVLGNMSSFMVSSEFGGLNQTYWNPEKMNQLSTELASIVDDAERDRRLRDLNRELYEEYWAIPYVIRNVPYGAGSRIADWHPTTLTANDYRFETIERAAP